MEEKRLTPIKAIRAKCLDCCCGNQNEVKLCPINDCPLYPYRLGKNPYIKLSEEQKAARAARLGKISPRSVGGLGDEALSEGRDTTEDETKKAATFLGVI